MKITVQKITTPRLGSPVMNVMYEAKIDEPGLNSTAYATEPIQALGRLVHKLGLIGYLTVVELPAVNVATAPIDGAGGVT